MEPEVLETDNTNEQSVENTIDPQTLPVEDLIHYEEELNELQNLSKTADNLSDIIQEGNEVGEEVYEKIEEAKKTLEEKADDIDPLDTVIVQESLKIYRKRLGMEELPASFNLEDATSNPTLAMTMNIEGLKEIGNTVLEGVMKAWKKLVEFLKAILKKFKAVITHKEKNLNNLKTRLNDPKNNIGEKVKERLKEMGALDAKNLKLSMIEKGVDDPKLRPLYKTLRDLHAFDLLGRKEYPAVFKTLVADLPNIISGLGNIIKQDLTTEELGQYLVKAFSKVTSGIEKLPSYNSVIKPRLLEAVNTKFVGLECVCSLIPMGDTDLHVILIGKEMNNKPIYLNINRLDIYGDFSVDVDPDNLAADTQRARDTIDGNRVLSNCDACIAAADKVTHNGNMILSKGIEPEAKAAVKMAMQVAMQLGNMSRYCATFYSKLDDRALTLGRL